MTEAEWQELELILSILKLFESLTKKLQAVQFTVSDFYASWIELKCEIESLAGIELVDNILTQIKFREEDFLQNDVIYSCVYLDARYQVLLNAGNFVFKLLLLVCTRYIHIADEKRKAMQHLVAIWDRKRRLDKDNLNQNFDQFPSDDVDIDAPISKMEMLLRQREIENRECQSPDDEQI